MTVTTIWSRRPGAALFTPQTDTDSMVLSESGSVPTTAPLFRSDWNTATGTTSNAISDGNKWPHIDVGSPQTLSVTAAPTGFPAGMANVLEVIPDIGGSCYFLPSDAMYAAPTAGTPSLYFRYYLQVAIADDQGDQSGLINACHHVQCSGDSLLTGGTSIWGWNFAPRANGTFRFEGHTYGYPVDNGPYDGWLLVSSGAGSSLNKANTGNAVYRIEWKVTRTAADTYTMDARIYDKDDVLVYSGDGVGASIGAIYQAGNPGVTLATAGTGLSMKDDHLRAFQIGSNNGGLAVDNNQRFYYGGVCVRSDNWCGPWTSTN